MRIHSEFSPTRAEHAWIADLLNGPHASDGGFARVVPYGDHKVLKATSCAATNAVFDTLKDISDCGLLSEALPAIFASHGPAVKDCAGQVYHVWEVERLFQPHEAHLMRAAWRHIDAYREPKSTYLGWKERISDSFVPVCDDLSQLQAALRQEQRRCGRADTWQGSAQIAMVMAQRTQAPLRSAFFFLLHFIETHQLQLDLLMRGNILLNMFGEPCLSDPVCLPDSLDEPAHTLEGTCVGALVPAKELGKGSGYVVLLPYSTLPLAAEEISNLSSELVALGVTPVEMVWGGKEHRSFMHKQVVKRVSELPGALEHMKENRYALAFAA